VLLVSGLKYKLFMLGSPLSFEMAIVFVLKNEKSRYFFLFIVIILVNKKDIRCIFFPSSELIMHI
jgi:hypothetical protein